MMKTTDVFRNNYFSALNRWGVLAFVLLGLLGCARTIKVFVPSPISLKQYGTIGIIDFTSNSDDAISRYATQLFREYVQAAQPGTPLLEIGTQKEVLDTIGSDQLNAKAIQKIGEVYNVGAVFIGDLVYSDVKTKFDVSQALSLKASMNTYIEATLTARLNLIENGAVIWSNSTSYKRTLSKLRVGKESGHIDINDTDPHKKLLPDMANEITRDFRGTYVIQEIPD